MLYTLNLYSALCQFDFNKRRRKNYFSDSTQDTFASLGFFCLHIVRYSGKFLFSLFLLTHSRVEGKISSFGTHQNNFLLLDHLRFFEAYGLRFYHFLCQLLVNILLIFHYFSFFLFDVRARRFYLPLNLRFCMLTEADLEILVLYQRNDCISSFGFSQR